MAEMTVAPNKKLVLVDAYSLLFRAFFGGRPLTTSDNRPTGALFGFTNMIFSILSNERPDAMVVCWDGPERTLRSQEYEAYKAHRPAVDPQLRAQFPVARDLVAAFGIQCAEEPGYEADDLIGTLATRGPQHGYHVVILTGDSDQLQLVNGHVRVQMTQRGVTEVKIYDADAVRERYGIGPERIADYKALTGDTSDNIPGVPGIGEKTATALLQQYDTLENLLAHIPEVAPARAKAALEANVEQARFSKRLATIVCDVPMEFEISPYAPTRADGQRLRALFLELEFRSMLSRIPRHADGDSLEEIDRPGPEATFSAQATLIEDMPTLRAALAEAKQSGTLGVRLELEGTAPMTAQLRAVAFAPSAERAYYVQVTVDVPASEAGLGNLFAAEEQEARPIGFQVPLTELRPLFEDAAIRKIGHNTKLAEIVLERAGLQPTPFHFDTLLAAYLLEAGRSAYPLTDLAATHLRAAIELSDAFVEGALPMQEAALVVALETPLREQLAATGMARIMDEVETPLVPVLAAIEEAGLLVDTAYLNTLGARLGAQTDAIANEVYALAGMQFNIGSPKQLQEVLFDKMQLPTGKKTKTGYSTGADVLEPLAPQYEIVQKILDYREIAKLKSTYADALVKLINPLTGRLHTSLNQTVTTTGRLSSSDPNLQNIPVRSEVGREIRRAFIAPPQKILLSCDYSQVELRLLAHITKDETLVRAFQADEDIHAATAAIVFNVPLAEVTRDQRRQAKTINFAVIYGQSAFALAPALGVSTSVASEWIAAYFARLPGVKRYLDETREWAHQEKYVQTLMGRRRYVPELDSGNHQLRQAAERAAINMPIQGTAADIMKLAMIQVQAYLKETCGPGCTLLLQVHDELLFEVEAPMLSAVTPEIVHIMQTAYPLDVPLKADAKAGPNWAEMEPIAPGSGG
jgi:DNA polymerase I